MRGRTARIVAKRRAVAAAVLAAAGLGLTASCGDQSRVDPDAAITVEGTVLAPDGSPLAGRPVRLGAGITDAEGALAVLSLGLSCTSGECTGDVFTTTTAADGTYRLTLRGADTQSSFGEAVSELLSVNDAPGPGDVSGAAVSARFRIQTERVSLPLLRLVDPGLTVDGPSDIVARWEPAAPGPYELTFEGADPVPVWRVASAETAATVDPRLLEDTAGRVVVGGGIEDAIEGSDVTVRWRSPGAGYAGGAGAPPSRGAPCHFGDAPAEPCGLTDGDLSSPVAAPPGCAAPDPSGACPPADAVVVELARPVPAELVVVRGCPSTCPVATSADGQAFSAAGAASGDHSAVALPGHPITAVRVGLGEPGFGLREVSVWGPRPGGPALLPVDAAVAEGFAGPVAGSGDRGDPPWPLVAVAAVLAAAAIAGVGFVAGRRRR